MADLFNAIVLWLNSICRASGFSYYELNILIYTVLIAALIYLLLWLVQ